MLIFRLFIALVLSFTFLVKSFAAPSFQKTLLAEVLRESTSVKVGIFAGALDPAHFNHRDIVQNAINEFGLDLVYVLPNLSNPHKPNATAYNIRKQITALTFASIPQVVLPDENVEMAFGHGEVIGLIRYLFLKHQGSHLYHIMGSDAIERYNDRFVALYTPMDRESFKRYHMVINVRTPADKEFLPESYGNVSVKPLVAELVEVSSTQIRKAFSQGIAHSRMDPDAVRFIMEQGLYGYDSSKATGSKVCESLLDKG